MYCPYCGEFVPRVACGEWDEASCKKCSVDFTITDEGEDEIIVAHYTPEDRNGD